ncbi:hypothetical protein P171DRAFT_461177 [Karstenula rhodostoma CBS 690.94]|uniref:AB hydrolase-1 domain-containing protein n=1 Tax=Karstenula rhodostoma CBS 690.94 TaxID=1392251 RepID=A0A9P4PPW1_9PLEO|nr:hypothetical protein P171DRAFT_461177 [Karstenula rhodostoma CBS 690.94]
MSSEFNTDFAFEVKEHVIPCQHIRGYPQSAREPSAVLRIAVKNYVPKHHADSSQPSVTIIAAHANGIVKETYEPLWEELNARVKGRIRGIWIADCSHQGASGILNENIQGDDHLLLMINQFRESIRPPIIGVAHSMGCAQLVQLATMHPQLFQSLILIEPVIQETIPAGPNAALMTSLRPDRWESLDSAKSHFMNNKFHKSWDRRALQKYLEYGLRRLPTALYPEDSRSDAVTLTTTKAQEAWSYVRSTFAPRTLDGQLDEEERRMTADYTSEHAKYVFHRAEAGSALHLLSFLQPSVKWIFGSRSYINRRAECESKIQRTGKDARGSGGVTAEFIDGGGHLVALEMIPETATTIASHIKAELIQYDKYKDFWDKYASGKSDITGHGLSKTWIDGVRQRSDTLRPLKAKEKL